MFVFSGPYRLSDVNVRANSLVANVVSPTAIAGLTHKLGCDLAALGGKLTVVAGGAIIHQYSVDPGHPKFAPTGSDIAKGKWGASIIESITGRATVSLFFEVRTVDGVDPDLVDLSDETALEVSLGKALVGCKLGGGRLHPQGVRNTFVREDAAVKVYLKELPQGWVLIDRKDLLDEALAHKGNLLQTVIDAVSLVPANPDEKDKADNNRKAKKREDKVAISRRRVHPMIVPIAAGYVALETPKDRTSARFPSGEYQHAYVEGVTSLGQYVSSKRLAHQEAAGPLANACWRYNSNRERGLYLVTT